MQSRLFSMAMISREVKTALEEYFGILSCQDSVNELRCRAGMVQAHAQVVHTLWKQVEADGRVWSITAWGGRTGFRHTVSCGDSLANPPGGSTGQPVGIT